MTTFFWILLSTFLISLIAFVGALTLFLKERVLNKILLLLVAFSAGALISGAFFPFRKNWRKDFIPFAFCRR